MTQKVGTGAVRLVNARIEVQVADRFLEAVKMNGSNISETLRDLINAYLLEHDLRQAMEESEDE